VTPAHIMAVLALGTLIGRQGLQRSAIGAYAVAVLAGLAEIALAYVPTVAQESVLAATAVTGLLLALARPLPEWIVALLAAAVGYSLALNSPPEALSLAQANMQLAVTAVVAIAAVWLIASVANRLTRDWQQLGARILGSWIAASAILVLALMLFR
jgi:hypothetical protein